MLKDLEGCFFTLLCLVLFNTACTQSADLIAQTTEPIQSTVTSPSLTGPDKPPTSVPHEGTPVIAPTVIDKGIVYGEPCSPPCWEGIAPGVSSREDVLSIFEKLRSEGRVRHYSEELLFAQFSFGGTVRVRFTGGAMVDSIEVDLYGFDYRAQQVIERFGEPETYASYFTSPDSPDCSEWNEATAYLQPRVYGYLAYPSQGITFMVEIPSDFRGSVCPNMRTGPFYYYQPRSLRIALQEDLSPVFGGNVEPEQTIEWHGFGPGY